MQSPSDDGEDIARPLDNAIILMGLLLIKHHAREFPYPKRIASLLLRRVNALVKRYRDPFHE